MQPLNNWHDRHSLACPNYLNKLPHVELEITRGRVRNRIRPMRNTTFLIGAGHHCDLVLGDPQFEDVHSYLLWGSEGLLLRHLGFNPELTVDGCPVRKAVLWDQARIRTGPFEFRVHIRAAVGGGAAASWDGTAADAMDRRWSDSRGQLRVFRDHDERHESSLTPRIVEGRARASRRPPAWRHLSQLILST
jgi:hypothetical protein